MTIIRGSIEVDVPVSTAYNQWTQFEEFPQFMEGVDRVEHLDDTMLRWTVSIAGQERTWEAKILTQEPDRQISWAAVGDTVHAGTVTFHELAPDRTRVDVEMEYEPQDWIEKTGDALNLIERRVDGDIERFKEFIESRGVESGAWRGRVTGGEPTA
ncbi:MAG TPA: SRPBCC family protein [Actinomycetota bacterium]|nr:SRPBCC family protein [Actinomycetota bacterium]